MQRGSVHPSDCRCRAVVQEGDERAALWTKLRGDLSWPLLGPFLIRADNGRFLRGRLFDLDRDQRLTLYEFVSHRRGGTVDEVRTDLVDIGWVPIIHDGVEVRLCSVHLCPKPTAPYSPSEELHG